MREEVDIRKMGQDWVADIKSGVVFWVVPFNVIKDGKKIKVQLRDFSKNFLKNEGFSDNKIKQIERKIKQLYTQTQK